MLQLKWRCSDLPCTMTVHLETSAAHSKLIPADKAQTGERSRNADGTLSGADRSTASDAEFWNQDDVHR